MNTEKINGEVLAAITMALYEYRGGTAHDAESGRLTLGAEHTEWNSKLLMQRKLPEKKF